MSTKPLRWGIVGTAGIARKNWQALHHAGNSVLTAVASRDLDRARRFIAECQAEVPFATPPTAFGSYQALIESPTVDAIYLPLPTGLRHEWVLRAAAAGKHVVCEKPCARDAVELREMIAACRHAGVQFMDGVMFVHSRRLARLKEVLAEGSSVGEVRRITSQFSFRAPEGFADANIRAHSDLEPLGCLGDLGWYCLRLALELRHGRLPVRVSGRVLATISQPGSPRPVPAEFSGELDFGDGVTSGFFCSFLAENQEWAVISGSRGYIHLPDFVLPFHGDEAAFDVHQTSFDVSGCRFHMRPHPRRISVPEASNNHPSAQETRLFRHFADAVLGGRLNGDWPRLALHTQLLVDACVASAREDGRWVGLSAH